MRWRPAGTPSCEAVSSSAKNEREPDVGRPRSTPTGNLNSDHPLQPVQPSRHLRTELVVDALDMARWRRKPTGTILHSDRGLNTPAGESATGSVRPAFSAPWGKVSCAYDNALMGSFGEASPVLLG